MNLFSFNGLMELTSKGFKMFVRLTTPKVPLNYQCEFGLIWFVRESLGTVLAQFHNF